MKTFAFEARARGSVGREAPGQGGEVFGKVGAPRGRGSDVGHDPVLAALRRVATMFSYRVIKAWRAALLEEAAMACPGGKKAQT